MVKRSLVLVITALLISNYYLSHALTNDSNNLILESGESISLSGEIYKNQLILMT